MGYFELAVLFSFQSAFRSSWNILLNNAISCLGHISSITKFSRFAGGGEKWGKVSHLRICSWEKKNLPGIPS